MWIDVTLSTATITVGTIFRLNTMWLRYLPCLPASLYAPTCAPSASAARLRLLGQGGLPILGEPEMDEA